MVHKKALILESDIYITSKEAAALIRCHPQELIESRMTGYLLQRPAPDHIKVGERKVIYKRSDILDWIESGRVVNIAGAESTNEQR